MYAAMYTAWQLLRIIVIVGLLMLVVWASLRAIQEPPPPPAREAVGSEIVLVRWHDPVYAVTCWVHPAGQSIACLPDASFE